MTWHRLPACDPPAGCRCTVRGYDHPRIRQMKFTLTMLVALTLILGAGRVQTRDGKSIEGKISLDDNAVIVGGPSDSRIAWDQVAKLTMHVKPDGNIVTARAAA